MKIQVDIKLDELWAYDEGIAGVIENEANNQVKLGVRKALREDPEFLKTIVKAKKEAMGLLPNIVQEQMKTELKNRVKARLGELLVEDSGMKQKIGKAVGRAAREILKEE